MAREIHIERIENPITQAEWIAVVQAAPDVCLASEARTARGRRADAAVHTSEDVWDKTFLWTDDCATFTYDKALENPEHPVRQAAVALTRTLNAKITGDRGEDIPWL